jgi:energy-coupling factor transporter ATP-binding protein EcfA2
MPRLRSVVIRRFKRIEQVEIPLDNVTLLIGANNAGKSSILQAIHLAVSIAQTARLVGEGVAWRNDVFELSFNPAQLLYSPVADVLSLATGGTLHEQRNTQIEIECRTDTNDSCLISLRRGRNRNIAVSITGRVVGEALMSFAEPFTVYAPGLAGVPKEERYLSPGVVRRTVARGDANLALRNVLRMLSPDQAAWAAFIDDMRSIFGGIDIKIDFDEQTDEAIHVTFAFPGGPTLPIDAAGTSVLQASQILAYVGLFRPQVLILDEPDSHLHPDNQRILCELVISLTAKRGFQALISTHSRHVLDAMKNQCTVVWLSKGTRIPEADLNTTSVLMDLGALDSVDYFADGETRCVVATEDSDQGPLRAILWSNGFVEGETEVASYSGCTKLDSALVLGGFLREKAPNVRLVVHRDRDYLSGAGAADFEGRLRTAALHPLLTRFSDIEGYFLNQDHLSHVNPGLTPELAAQLIDQATQDTRDASVIAIVNQRTTEAFRIRQAGGPAPNHGQIAIDATASYDADPVAMRRGKEVFRRLKALLQQTLGANPRIFLPSPHLQLVEVSQIAHVIWPP